VRAVHVNGEPASVIFRAETDKQLEPLFVSLIPSRRFTHPDAPDQPLDLTKYEAIEDLIKDVMSRSRAYGGWKMRHSIGLHKDSN
jgi:hypothetical protein